METNTKKMQYGENDQHKWEGLPDTPENRKKSEEGRKKAVAFAKELKRRHANDKNLTKLM